MDELTLTDYLTILRRWKKVFLTTVSALMALSLIFVMAWSNYRATAVVQIEQPEISSNATTPIGGSPRDQVEALADQRISAIEQKVLSTASLIEIITKFDLYQGARKKMPVADVAENMRKKIRLELVSSTLANPAAATRDQLSAIAFRLSFDYSNPLLTQQVADEIVTRFLDEDLKERRTESEETSAFLAAQIATMEASLSEQEKKIADYQKEHGVTRPETLALTQQAATTVMMDMQNLNGQIATIEGNIGTLRAQLATVDPYSRVISDGQVLTTPSVQLKALQAQYAALTAQYGPEHPDVVKVRHQIEALQPQVGHMTGQTAQLKAQIADVRANLAAARKTYGDQHPDVVSLRNQLQKLEDQLAGQRASAPGSITADADNPAYLQLVAELNAAEDQHKSLLQQRKELKEQQDKYQQQILGNPEAEQEMASLSRDYDNAQLRYRELKEKKMDADMNEKMQQDRKGQRLSLIDPPKLPIGTHPGRLLLMIGCFFLSLTGGIVGVAVAQMLGQSVIGIRHLESLVGSSPLVSIPHIYTKLELENAAPAKALVFGTQIKERFEKWQKARTENFHG